MDRRKSVLVIISLISVIAILYIIILIEFYPFGHTAKSLTENTKTLEDYHISNDIPNTSIYIYKADIRIRNKSEFVEYLKSNATIYKKYNYTDIPKYELGNFIDNNSNVNWQNVLNSVKIYRIGWKKVYSLEYKTLDPGCNIYKLDITSDGYIRDYRSAGF